MEIAGRERGRERAYPWTEKFSICVAKAGSRNKVRSFYNKTKI